MSMSKPLANLAIWAGLWVAPLVWAANMQLGQILPYADCYGRMHASAIASFLCGAVAALSSAVSWRYARGPNSASETRQIAVFGAFVSALSAALFTFALVMQGIASMVLTGCER